MTEPARGGNLDRAPRRPSVSSTDVARRAGVSQKTVSRVFNHEQYVSTEARDRVLDAARELGYRPNGAARALTLGRSRCIGVVALGSALYGPASQLVAVERAARQHGYAVRVVNTAEGDPRAITTAVDTLLEQGVDGIVLAEPIDEGTGPIRVEVPTLTMGTFPHLTAPLVVAVGGTGVAQAVAATDHLLGLGHRTVHHIAGPQRWFSARERLEGWRRALRAAGAPEPEALQGDWSARSGVDAGLRLAADPDVTAVFAANDDMAIGLVHALTRAGRRVPDDVSVVGFDDIPVAGFVNPPLTTVRQSFDALTEAGLRRLLDGIERLAYLEPVDGAPAAEPVALDADVDLVVRASTAPPPPSPSPPSPLPPTPSRRSAP